MSMRLLLGFIAGCISHLVVEGALGAILHAAAVVPVPPWSFVPVPPLGVPQTVSLAFWAGLWGVSFALLEPRLTALFGRWRGGLVFGLALPLLGDWFVALPLKGRGVGGGFHLETVPTDLALNAALGVGTVVLFYLALCLSQPHSPTSLDAARG